MFIIYKNMIDIRSVRIGNRANFKFDAVGEVSLITEGMMAYQLPS
jgi:hypothetical protein